MSFTLRWKNPNVISTVVKIYRDVKDITPSALPEPIATLSNGETEWRDTTATPGATYYYLLTVTANGKTVASSSQKYTIEMKRGIGPMTILNGNDRLGFMGAVPYDEQWLPSQMPPAFLAMFPNLLTDRVALYKFTRNGKIYYMLSNTSQFPNTPVDWASLYQAGLVYGTGDAGPENGHGTLPATPQDAKIVHKGDTYIMRLPRGLTMSSESPAYPFVADYNGKTHDEVASLTNPCEYNDLLYTMVNEVPKKQRWANWATYSYNYLGQGTLGTSATYFGGGVLCMEHDTTEDRVLHRGIFNNAGGTPVSAIQRINYLSPTTKGRYYPIFELVE
ncbi:hypothetical protein ACRN6O_001977 [Salmonella enterica subsp. enterica serovar Chester]